MRPIRVFIVDDDVDFAESLAEVIEGRGHHVEVAHSGEEAVARFRDNYFDIAFLDVKLPGMNGVESFFEIRRLKPEAKVMMMTAFSVEQLLRQAVENGALGVLIKPLDFDKVFEALDAVTPAGGLVLVADDDPDFADSIGKVLTARGHAVLVAHTGREALDTVHGNDIDYLVLDLRLPVMSGLEVYMELKKRGRTVPTVIVTGYAEEEADAVAALRRASVLGCFVKPFDPAELVAMIDAMSVKDE